MQTQPDELIQSFIYQVVKVSHLVKMQCHLHN